MSDINQEVKPVKLEDFEDGKSDGSPPTKRARGESNKSSLRYLCVAQSDNIAERIARILSNENYESRSGLSTNHDVYTFSYEVNGGESAECVMTSVAGHLLEYEFKNRYYEKTWRKDQLAVLFDEPVHKICNSQRDRLIKETIEREVDNCNRLIIWTNCNREGENIGFEIIKVCRSKNPKISIDHVYRAKFSVLSEESIHTTMRYLGSPNKDISDAVDVRCEIDYRTGRVFTRLQTLHLREKLPNFIKEKDIIKYGSCLLPTLGFVVEQFQKIENSIPDEFWKIRISHTLNESTTEFSWKPPGSTCNEKIAVQSQLDTCRLSNLVTITSVIINRKSKSRPLPLNAIEMQKTISRKKGLSAKQIMDSAQELYKSGYISYPITESTTFPGEVNLQMIVEQHLEDPNWGEFARRIMNEGGPTPNQEINSGQEHPPIYPIKYANGLGGNKKIVYEYIVRHFLACIHKDAQGQETIVQATCGGIHFTAKGLRIQERNYLDVYNYDEWNGLEIHEYKINDTFEPSRLELGEDCTSQPNFLTEADLMERMQKNGIGTDSTFAQHIESIKTSRYVAMHQEIYLLPTVLGIGLIQGYNNMDLPKSLTKPDLRSDFEENLRLICNGVKPYKEVLRDQIEEYKEIFRYAQQNINSIVDRLRQLLQPNAQGGSTLP